MNKIYKKTLCFISTLGLLVIIIATPFGSASATVSPTLSISNETNGYTQITVYADPNAPVMFYYDNLSNNNLLSVNNIGYTNSSGYFTTSISSASYNILPNSYIYVMVDGMTSQNVLWSPYNYNSYTNTYQNNSYVNTYPNNYNNIYYPNTYVNPISLSQNNINLYSGQSSSINIYGGYNSYYVYSNSNPYIVSASVNGSTLNLYANNPGTATITVCQNNLTSSCAIINVSVINNIVYPQTVVYHKKARHFRLPFGFGFNFKFMNRY